LICKLAKWPDGQSVSQFVEQLCRRRLTLRSLSVAWFICFFYFSCAEQRMSAEQLRQLELQRQAARERRAQRSAAAAASSTAPPAAPVAAAPATTSAEARYVDFRLSELKDTRGGFFSGDVSSNSSQYGSNRAMTGTLADGLLSGEQRRRRRHKKSALPERTVIEEQCTFLGSRLNVSASVVG